MFCTGSTKISPRGQEAKASSQTPPRPLILEPVSWQVSETLRRRHRCLFQISALTTFIFSSLCFSYWSSNFIYLSILSTLAPSHVLPGDGTPVCSRHRAVFLCAERPAALSEGPEERQGHMEPRLLGQTGVMRAASPLHGGNESCISEPLSGFTTPSSPTGSSGSSRKTTSQTLG